MLLVTFFQHHEWQLLYKVRTKATDPRIILAKYIPPLNTAAENEVCGAADMTTNKQMQFLNYQLEAETETTTWCLPNRKRITNQLEREIYEITLNERKRFQKEFSIRVIELDISQEKFIIQVLRKTIEQWVIHLGYSEMHHVSLTSQLICQMGSGESLTTDISEQIHISNMIEAYLSINKVYSIEEMIKHNDRPTGLDFMEKTRSYLALQSRYDKDYANGFDLLSATD